jgi:hypothetical protein
VSAIKQKILNSIQDGNFLEIVYQAYFEIKSEPDENLGVMLSELHNDKQLNLLVEFLKLNYNDSKRDFFTLRHAFAYALPFLDAPVLEVMLCVKHLTIEAKGDMSQGLLIGPFMEYCKKIPSRISEVLTNSLANIDEDFDFISPSLIAGSEIDFNCYFDMATGLVANSQTTPEVLRRAIFSLGRMRYANANQTSNAFLTISKRTAEVDSQSFSVCLRALFNIYVQDLSLDRDFLGFVSDNSHRYDDQAIYTVSEILYLNDSSISDAVQELLLEIVAKVNPEHKGTIDNIDWVLMKLFDKGRAESALRCFEIICVHSGKEISIQKLDSFSRKLIDNSDQIAYSYPKEPLITTAKRPPITVPKRPLITIAKKPLPILNQALAFVFIITDYPAVKASKRATYA